MRDEHAANDVTLASWHQMLENTLSDVADGDTITSLYIPGGKSPFFHNGQIIARIDDPAFLKAYFDIWLGAEADDDMRNGLLGRAR